MLAALGKTAARAISQQLEKQLGRPAANPASVPSALITRTLHAPSPELLDAYIAHVGGDPRAYKGTVPPHFFPHWVMPVAADTLSHVPYPITRVLNGGCRMQINRPIPRGEALEVSAQLTSIDDDGRRAVLTQHVVTSTASAPEALVVDIYAIVPLSGHIPAKQPAALRSGDTARKPAEKARVPLDAKEIGFTRLRHDAGLSFAKLTGDFNPIHWLTAAAKAAGFRNVILHGFGTLARGAEALNRGVFGGDAQQLTTLDVKFTRPLVLPHEVGYFVRGNEVFVGDALGGPAYMTGRFDTKGGAL